MDFEVVKRLLATLEREQVRYAIFCAVALNLHGLETLRVRDGVEPSYLSFALVRRLMRDRSSGARGWSECYALKPTRAGWRITAT